MIEHTRNSAEKTSPGTQSKARGFAAAWASKLGQKADGAKIDGYGSVHMCGICMYVYVYIYIYIYILIYIYIRMGP